TLERDVWLVWAACLAIEIAGLVAARAHLKRNRDAAELPLVPALLFAGDLAAIFLVVSLRPASLLALSLALALATMVFVVTSAGAWLAIRFAALAVGLWLLGAAPLMITDGLLAAAVAALPVVVGGAAMVLVRMADRHHAANVERTVEDLATFALVTPEYATEMLATATGILADNWRESRRVGPDAVARWYEENSEYYLYDLAQFHLAYKHIAFMRDVVALADGRVLDFGAGIGDLALELGRLGHE